MKKKIFIFTPIFMCTLILITAITPTIAMSENISNKVFRLHILANSDSEIDQNLKLQVRDAVLDATEVLFNNCNSIDEAKIISQNNINLIIATANKVIKNNGFNYNVKAYVDQEFFETRHYDNFSLPAGKYDCLKIVIGKGNGHNWWCVMYPSVCLSGCVDDFDNELTDEEKNIITSKDYEIRFKIVEIYEKIKYSLI